ncbi:MAG TPA: serine hydrolase domain-containing protein [Streptosporangiaceae bacterium]
MSWSDRRVTSKARPVHGDRRAGRTARRVRHCKGNRPILRLLGQPAAASESAAAPWRLLGAGTAAAMLWTVIAAAGPAAAAVPTDTAAGPGFRAALEQIVDDGVPGAIGLARRGGRVMIAATGVADVATAQPMTARDRIRVGSIIKTFVAAVVLQLAGEHRLQLGDSVARWLPGLVPDGRAITLRELLQHTSGLFDYFNEPGFEQAFKADPTRTWRPRALIRIAVAHPPLFPPGTAFAYSNTDYILLGLVIEKATGQPLGRELRDRIFAPLGLHHTSLPFANVIPPRPYAHGYLLNQPGAPGPVDITQVSPSIAWAAGGLLSTAQDVGRFYTALLTGRVLPPPLLRQMLTTVPIGPGAGYGLGIVSLQAPCGTVWGHNGNFPGYLSNAFTTLGGGRQVIVLINATGNTLTAQQNADLGAALSAGLCGTG